MELPKVIKKNASKIFWVYHAFLIIYLYTDGVIASYQVPSLVAYAVIIFSIWMFQSLHTSCLAAQVRKPEIVVKRERPLTAKKRPFDFFDEVS